MTQQQADTSRQTHWGWSIGHPSMDMHSRFRGGTQIQQGSSFHLLGTVCHLRLAIRWDRKYRFGAQIGDIGIFSTLQLQLLLAGLVEGSAGTSLRERSRVAQQQFQYWFETETW